MFDKPAEAQFMNTYVELPFKEIAAMGEQLDKTREEAEALNAVTGAQNLKHINDKGHDDPEKAKEIMQKYDDKVAEIEKMYWSDTKKAKSMATTLAKEQAKDMQSGEWYSIAARESKRQADIKEIQDTFFDAKGNKEFYNPAKGDFYLSQLGASQRNYDPATGKFGQVTSRSPVPIWTAEAKQKYLEEGLNTLRPDQIVDGENLKNIGTYSATEILRNPNLRQYVNEERLQALITARVAAAPDLLAGEREAGEIAGATNDWGDIYKRDKDGKVEFYKDEKGNDTGVAKYDTSTPLGAYVNGLLGGYSYEQKTLGSTISVKNEETALSIKKKFDDQNAAGLVNITPGTAIEITGDNFETYQKTLVKSKAELDKLEKMITAPGAKNQADYEETYNTYLQTKAQYYNSKNAVAGISEDVAKKLGYNKNVTQHLKNFSEYDNTPQGMLKYLEKMGIKLYSKEYNNKTNAHLFRKDGSIDSSKNSGMYLNSYIEGVFAQKTGLNLKKIEKATEEVFESGGDKYTIQTHVLNDQSTGEYKSVIGENNKNNTEQYVQSGGTGWQTLDGKQVEAWILDNIDGATKVNAGNRKVLQGADSDPINGKPIHSLAILNNDGAVIGTINVTKADGGSDQYENAAKYLIGSKKPESMKTGYEMLGQSGYSTGLTSVNIKGMKAGETKLLPFTAEMTTNTGVKIGEPLKVVASKGANDQTIEYQIVNSSGKTYTKKCAGIKDLYMELGKQKHFMLNN